MNSNFLIKVSLSFKFYSLLFLYVLRYIYREKLFISPEVFHLKLFILLLIIGIKLYLLFLTEGYLLLCHTCQLIPLHNALILPLLIDLPFLRFLNIKKSKCILNESCLHKFVNLGVIVEAWGFIYL